MTFPGNNTLLIEEIQGLSGEVAGLRSETAILAEEALSRDEYHAYRRTLLRLGLAALLVVALALGSVIWAVDQTRQAQNDLAQVAYESCLIREEREQRQGPAVAAVNALLGDLAKVEQSHAQDPSASTSSRQAAKVRRQAYDRYLAYVAEAIKQPPGPQPLPCESYLR